MIRRFFFLFLAVAMTGLVACGDGASDGDADLTADTAAFSADDYLWDADDAAFAADLDSARAAHARIAAAATSDRAAKAVLDAHNAARAEWESRRAAARSAREAARAANDRAAYDAARAQADYQTWRVDLGRIRTEQVEIEGMINIGS